MCKKWFAILFIVAYFISCSPYKGGGELTGSRKSRKWFEPQPYGMVLIPTGSLNIGNNDEDITWAMSATAKTVSIPAFWMDETEITNNEYRQFVAWVIDSIRRQRLADEGYEEFLMHERKGELLEPPRLNYDTRIDLRKQEYREALAGMMYQGDDDRSVNGDELDVRKLEYAFTWYDFTQAAQNDRFYDPETGTYKGGYVINADGEKEPVKGRASFILKKKVKVYPDTLCWLKDLTYSYNEPFVQQYFTHVGYDNYPVVGVNWHQARAFCHWRTQYFNAGAGVRVQEWRLPNEAEWEYAARGGLMGAKYPWGGPYTRNEKGCFLANFKPLRGNYISDGGYITVPVGTYAPNGYGLYDMAGNVSEWTGDAFDVSAYQVTHDLNPYYQRIPKKTDNKISKRKTIRGGSWKDVAHYLQCGVRDYEYADSARCFIGFRTVRTRIEY